MTHHLPLFFLRSIFLIATILLISCSGGGGDTPPPDTTAPSVVLGSPTPTGLDVVRNTTVNVTFSEAMDITTLNSYFQVKESGPGGGDVPGTITRSGNTYTFTPASLLQSNTTYDVTITTGVTDLAGNALTVPEVWSFTTGSTLAVNITWDPNRETAVNTTGGGYKVYYSTSQGFGIADVGVTEVDVPYVSGSTAPTSISLNLQSATTYYFRVVAYSGPPINSASAPSAESSLVVP